MRLGLKYCGGCCPRFDRVEWVTEFQEKLDGDIVFLPYDSPEVEAVLVVMGCESACVDLSPFVDKPVFLVWNESQMDQIIQKLKTRFSSF